MQNLVKDKIMEMVKRQIKGLEGTTLVWPDYSTPSVGHIVAGSGKIEVRDISNSEAYILIKTTAGTRWFRVKITEMVG